MMFERVESDLFGDADGNPFVFSSSSRLGQLVQATEVDLTPALVDGIGKQAAKAAGEPPLEDLRLIHYTMTFESLLFRFYRLYATTRLGRLYCEYTVSEELVHDGEFDLLGFVFRELCKEVYSQCERKGKGATRAC